MTPAELKAIRAAMGVSPERLGADMGVTGRTVRYWESGRSPIPGMAARLLRRLAEAEEVAAEMRAQREIRS